MEWLLGGGLGASRRGGHGLGLIESREGAAASRRDGRTEVTGYRGEGDQRNQQGREHGNKWDLGSHHGRIRDGAREV